MTAEAILLLALSPLVGSFLALLHDRLPRGEPVMLSRSRCRACGGRLGVKDLMPIVSYLFSRRRCYYCGAPIPGDVFWIEAAAIGLAAAAVNLVDGPLQVTETCVLLWLLLPLATIDMRHFLLPDALTLALLVSGLAFAFAGERLEEASVGALAGAGSFAAIRLAYRAIRNREGLGLGDVKLMAGLGAWLGPLLLPSLVVLAACGGIAATLLWGIWHECRLSGDLAAPFGAFLCIAAMVLWLALLAL